MNYLPHRSSMIYPKWAHRKQTKYNYHDIAADLQSLFVIISVCIPFHSRNLAGEIVSLGIKLIVGLEKFKQAISKWKAPKCVCSCCTWFNRIITYIYCLRSNYSLFMILLCGSIGRDRKRTSQHILQHFTNLLII